MSNTNHSITNLKAINVKVKNYAIFWPGRTKDKSNDNAFLYLQSIISCITNDPVIVDSVILTGCKGKMVGVEREGFEHCPEKCCRAGQLECLMIYLNFILATPAGWFWSCFVYHHGLVWCDTRPLLAALMASPLTWWQPQPSSDRSRSSNTISNRGYWLVEIADLGIYRPFRGHTAFGHSFIMSCYK